MSKIVMTYSDIRQAWDAFWRDDIKKFDRRKAKENIAIAQSQRIIGFLSLYKTDSGDVIIPNNIWTDLEREVNSSRLIEN